MNVIIDLNLLGKMGLKQLNEFQKRALDVIASSNKNVILKAPTGSGKTEIAVYLMANSKDRVVFMSPLKALSLQVYEKVKKYTDAVLVTGDEWIDPPKIKERVVITTYEKFDSMIRHGTDLSPSLIIIDEIHNISNRPAIENAVTYALLKKIRVIAMSASIGNVEKLKQWLDAELVEDKVRKVPLYIYVKSGRKIFGDPKYLKEMRDPIDFAVKRGKPVLVFARSRFDVQKVYKQFKQKYGDLVTSFHGGLDPETRVKIIHEIERKEKLIVVSTTALGQGVNLPIWMVYFNDMSLPVIEDHSLKGWRPLTKNEFDQIAGRAGRPGFDEDGVVVIEAKNDTDLERKIDMYIDADNEKIVGSGDLYNFIMFLLVLSPLSLKEIMDYLSRSLSFRDTLEEEVEEVLAQLEDSSLIEEKDGKYHLTEIGKVIMTSYLDAESAVYYLPRLSGIKRIESILFLVSNSPKVKEVARGKDVTRLILQWVNGRDPDVTFMFTKKDFYIVKDVAEWQAYSLFKLCEVTKKCDAVTSYLAYEMIKYGVPATGIEFAKKMSRREVIELLDRGITTLDELCKKGDKEKIDRFCL